MRRASIYSLVVLSLFLAGPSTFGEDGNWVSKLFKRVDPAVCMVHDHQAGMANGLGSGVVIDAQAGLVLTAYHVVDGVKHVGITFHRSENTFTTVRAKVVAKNKTRDLAVLQIEGKRPALTDVPIGLGDLEIGDDVVAIGNPFGLTHSCNAGRVSRITNMELHDGDDLETRCLQVDAATNFGNSGGGLFGRDGSLAGITVLRISPFFGDGIGFAVSASTVEKVVLSNITPRSIAGVETGVETAYHGRRNADSEWVVRYQEGVFVKSASGAASEAKLKKGDKLLKVTFTGDDDEKVVREIKTRWDFNRAFFRTSPGDHVQVTVERAGKEVSVSLKLRGPGLEEDGTVTPPDDDLFWWW